MSAPLAVAAALLALASALPAQDGIRIVRVPEKLVLPAEPGTNPLLEVAVAGRPSLVWLATGPEARGRVLLDGVGEGRWQLNLAEPLVAALVAEVAAPGTLTVFAQVDGRTLRSPPIAFAAAPRPSGQPECAVHGSDGPKVLRGRGHRSGWFLPATAQKIEVSGAGGPPRTRVVAHAGAETWTLEHGVGGWSLVLDGARRQAWQAAGQLEVAAQEGNETPLRYVLHAVPEGLEPEDGITFAVVQRHRVQVPGSRAYLTVALGDITAGQVLLSLRTADHVDLVEQRSLAQGEHVTFTLAGQHYVLVVRRLVNVLIGDDFAELEVLPRGRFERGRIDALLERIEKAGVTFVREGKAYTGAEAAEHLRGKLQAAGAGIATVDDFIEQIASRSSTTGNPYLVRSADATEEQAADWFRREARELERKGAKRPPGPERDPGR